jgi:hypoxanthine phosphoribosyltransferase
MYKHSILFTEERIRERIAELARTINEYYAERTVDIVCILKGALFFVADLTRRITVPARIHFIQVNSYGNETNTSGTVTVQLSSIMNLQGCEVLLVEDILDTGITMQYLFTHLQQQQPESLKLCVLLDKAERHRVAIRPDFCGFRIADHFVIGYGLDYREFGRNLPYIGVLDPEEYRK